jgi:hypothetical protein
MTKQKSILKFRKKKSRFRCLREFERVAQVIHFCDNCMHEILPGSIYRGKIFIEEKGISVFKIHVDPDCPVDPLEEDRRQEELDNTLDEQEQNEALKKLAIA